MVVFLWFSVHFCELQTLYIQRKWEDHYTHHFEFVLVEILTLDVVVDLPRLLLTGRQITARRFLRPVDHPYSHGHSDVPPEYMATNRNMALVKKEYPPSEQH